MAEVFIVKGDDGTWRPAEEMSWKRLTSFPKGVSCYANIKDPSRRSSKQNAFWFAMVTELFKNQEKYTNFDHFRQLLLIFMGRADFYPAKDGGSTPIAHSLKFGSMSQDEFSALVEATLDAAEAWGYDRDALLEKTKGFAPWPK